MLGSFTRAIAQINAMPQRPAFVVHTGDLTHTSTPEQFNTVKELLGTLKTPQVVVDFDDGQRVLLTAREPDIRAIEEDHVTDEFDDDDLADESLEEGEEGEEGEAGEDDWDPHGDE